jgi:alpha-glucosidase
MPWAGERPPFDFSTNPDTWLPMPADWATLTVEAQDGDPLSTLAFYRRAIELRHGRADFSELALEFLDVAPDVVAFRGGDGLVCVLNAGTEPVALPDGELVIASALADGKLPPNAAAWLR